MELIKADTGLGDLELADVYNEYHRTMLPGPLREKHAPGLREALGVARETPRSVR